MKNKDKDQPISERLKRKIKHDMKKKQKNKKNQQRIDDNRSKVQEVKEAKVKKLIDSDTLCKNRKTLWKNFPFVHCI